MERLQKVIAASGYTSRRKAEDLIVQGKVKVNGQIVDELGTKVKKGDILCIVEAMKLMNEIESEYDGEVVEILAKDDDMVEYGQVLIKIK